MLGCVCWHISLRPVLGRQRQADLWDFKASLFYKESSKTPELLHRKTLSQINKNDLVYQCHQKTSSPLLHCKSIKQLGMGAHTLNPSSLEVEAGGSLWVQNQPGLHRPRLHSESQPQKKKMKNLKQLRCSSADGQIKKRRQLCDKSECICQATRRQGEASNAECCL